MNSLADVFAVLLIDLETVVSGGLHRLPVLVEWRNLAEYREQPQSPHSHRIASHRIASHRRRHPTK
jgi:hypothetical protein